MFEGNAIRDVATPDELGACARIAPFSTMTE
jgi:hypothetical protein